MKLKYVIVTSTCNKCHTVDELVKEKGMSYERKVIADIDEDGMNIAREYMATSVPCFVFVEDDGTVVTKFTI